MTKNTEMSWQIGYGECDITPVPGHAFMAGFGIDRICKGTHAPLRAQALAIADETGNTSLLITADIIGFDRTTVDALRYSIQKKHNIPEAAVVFCASHTHWGPATLMSIGISCGAANPWYVVVLEKKLLEIVDKAVASLKPATLRYGENNVQIGVNRRLPADGGIAFAPNPAGHYDTHTPILYIERKDSLSEIMLVGHACHPTSSGAIEKWTPDYPGAMRDHFEYVRGNKSRAMFVMGCGADAKVAHLDPATGEIEFAACAKHAESAGKALADAIIARLNNDQFTVLTGQLTHRHSKGSLSFGKKMSTEQIAAIARGGERDSFETWWARQMRAQKIERENFPYEAITWTFGNLLTISFLEGEVCSPLGPHVRSLAPTPWAMTVAYANAVSGYIPSKKILMEGGYEGEISHRAYLLPAPFSQHVEDEFFDIVSRCMQVD